MDGAPLWIPVQTGVYSFPAVDAFEDLDPTPDKRNAAQLRLASRAWVALLSDSPLNKTFGLKTIRVVNSFYKTLQSSLFETIRTYSALADEMVSQPHRTDYCTSTGAFIIGMQATPVFKEYLHWHRTGDTKCFRYVYTFLVFLKKMDFDDPELETKALRSWLDVEERLANLELPTWTEDLRTIVGWLVPADYTDAYHMPKFGPGRVSERGIRGIVEKAQHLLYDERIDRAFYGEGARCFGLPVDNGFHRDYAIPGVVEWNKDSSSISHSTLKFVPKNFKTRRSICMEPNTYMFHQQSYMRILLDFVSKGVGKRYIRLEDQGRNRRMSRYGSATGWYDTLDLSAASDSVSIDLVRRIFPRRVLYYLLATRSSRVARPDGEMVSVRKFAPMGSALCFPVQCIVFLSAIIRSAMCEKEGLRYDEVLGTQRMAKYIRGGKFIAFHRDATHYASKFLDPAVYGDDLVIDSRLTDSVIQSLTQLGFVINKEKSFVGDQAFRESCGGYYLDGEDVSPLYYSVDNCGPKDPSWLASIIDLVNRSGDHGRRNTGRVLHAVLRDRYTDILYTRDRTTSTAIFITTRPRNDHLKERLNYDLQRFEYRSVGLAERKGKKAALDCVERYLYVQYWNSSRKDVVLSANSASRRHPGDARVKQRWTPAW